MAQDSPEALRARLNEPYLTPDEQTLLGLTVYGSNHSLCDLPDEYTAGIENFDRKRMVAEAVAAYLHLYDARDHTGEWDQPELEASANERLAELDIDEGARVLAEVARVNGQWA